MESPLNDRYDLLARIGSGGMGEVWRAHDRRLDRVVAIKVMRTRATEDDVSRARMRSEALLAASIHHPGVAQIFDFEESHDASEGTSFIVMQFVDGHSLAELLRTSGPMAIEQVMSIVVQVASGLQAAHDIGVVHRDVKPANIMLTPAGRTVLVDFGIARSDDSEPLTETGTILGTAQYSSPEQSAGRPATPQSDLYSLGIVAHHCLTGVSPFRRENPVATALAHLNDDIPPLGDDVPPAARELIGTLTAKNPSQRPESAADVAERAASIGADDRIDIPRTLGSDAPHRDTLTVSAPVFAASSPATSTHRSRVRAGALAAVGLLVILVSGWAVWPRGDTAVPDVVGMSRSQATALIEKAGMTARAQPVDVAGQQRDAVLEQSPAAGAARASDGVVQLKVVSGKVAVAANDIIGLTYPKAVSTLEKLGFVVKRTDVPQSAEADEVVALDRSGRLPEGSTITLSVAVAPAAQPATGGTAKTPSGGGSPPKSSPGKGKGKGKGKNK
ncbi:MAG: protein kinase [Aeromicrobium sp.]